MNKVILIGRVGETPSKRATTSGCVTNFSLATSINKREGGKTVRNADGHPEQITQWHRVTCFNGLGETVSKHVTKGKQIALEGRINYTKYTDKDGIDRYGCEIIADEVSFL